MVWYPGGLKYRTAYRAKNIFYQLYGGRTKWWEQRAQKAAPWKLLEGSHRRQGRALQPLPIIHSVQVNCIPEPKTNTALLHQQQFYSLALALVLFSSLCPSFTVQVNCIPALALLSSTKNSTQIKTKLKLKLLCASTNTSTSTTPQPLAIIQCGFTALSMCKGAHDHDWDFHHYTAQWTTRSSQKCKSQTRTHWDG